MKNLKIISRENLLHNLNQFEGKKICAMVKANAYGHGLREIVQLAEAKVDFFGVVNIDEGRVVRRLTDKGVLICSKIEDFCACRRLGLDVMVDDEESLSRAVKCGLSENLHLKINCGMNRFGVKSELSMRGIDDFLKEKNIKLRSIYTHFPRTENKIETKKNHENFLKLREKISQKTDICFGGSGIFQYDFDYDMLRLGIGMYGYGGESLLPVMSVRSHVNKVFYAKKGEFVGYGKAFRAKGNSFFAVVSVGYGDGLRRGLSGKFCVKINGKKFPAVGNICMDAFFVKVDESVHVGDEVEVMWDAEYLAKKCGTISYEILTGFSNLRGKTIIQN